MVAGALRRHLKGQQDHHDQSHDKHVDVEVHDAVKTSQRAPEDEKSEGNVRSSQTMANLLRDAHALTLSLRRPMQKLRDTQHASAMRNQLFRSAAPQAHSLTHHSAKDDQPR